MKNISAKYPISLDERRKRKEDPLLEDYKKEALRKEAERNVKQNSR